MAPRRPNESLGSPPEARQLIVNADDFGRCHAINAAPVRTLEAGIVRATGVMVPCPGSGPAPQRRRARPAVPAGVRLTIVCEPIGSRWEPVAPTERAPALLDAGAPCWFRRYHRLTRQTERTDPWERVGGDGMTGQPTPDRIMALGFGFWGAKTLLSGVELGIFSELATGALDGETLRERLGLHPRSARDFFDALVALGMLERRDGRYTNTPETDQFLDRAKPSYVGGILEMANARLYPFWGSLTAGLRSGEPQNEAKSGGDLFAAIYADPSLLRQFVLAMSGLSMGAAIAVAQKIPWGTYRTFVDIGTAQGNVPVQVAKAHPHLTGGGFDLPALRAIFEEYVASAGLTERERFYAGDFFADPLPSADVLILGHILYDWDVAKKRTLLAKAHAALPEGGRLVIYDILIDDERRQNAFSLLASLNMLIETRGGCGYTGADCRAWMREIGFREAYVEPLVGPESMVVGIK
jgi:hypothetical protein